VSSVLQPTCTVSRWRQRRTGARPSSLVAALLALPLLLPGCDTLRSKPEDKGGLSPVLHRIQQYYPDLASGRFISLADFEAPGHDMLFRIVDRRGQATGEQPSLSILRSRNETGAGSLKAVLTSANERLLFDGQRSSQLALVRDWRKYALLLASIHAPPGGAVVEFSIESGKQVPMRWTRTLQLRPGWNLFRTDLAGVGETVDLADVRRLAWSAPELDTPLELHIDDVLLADNTRYELGESAGPGELYVFTRGRRLHVGARDRFDLAFADGVLVAWNGVNEGNLADPGGLGPWPIPLTPGWSVSDAPPIAYDDPRLFASWGPAVAARQELTEATPFRVVVSGSWRFAGADAAVTAPGGSIGNARNSDIGHAWQYTIFPFGRLLVRVTSTPPATGWGAPRVGYAIGLRGRQKFRLIGPPPASPNEPSARFVLMTRPGRQRADLLWTWGSANDFTRQRELTSAGERRLAVIVGDVAAEGVVDTAHTFRVWPADIDDAPEARAFSLDCRNPIALQPTTGSLITDAPGDLNHDGYNETEGCYELATANDVLRFTFDPGSNLRFDPVFRVHGLANRESWVYGRGRVISTRGRDGAGNLLFRLAEVVSAPTPIEVHGAKGGEER